MSALIRIFPFSAEMSRKLWSKESMAAALQDVQGGMGVREAGRLYNLPYETLRRRVVEKVGLECRPGPPTVLTEYEEGELASYCVKMADMGFGLCRNDVMGVAYKIAESSGRKHPFTDGSAGRAWFDGFCARHPRLTLRSAQSLSRARACSANSEIITDYFAKLAAVCARLNLFSKPMNIYNMDETGVSIVHKPGKVVTEVGRRNVWGVTSAEKGKTHTILTCVSASGSALPPFFIYPRKRIMEKLKEGALPGTAFDTGWVNTELFIKWFEFFLLQISPSRPVLLILDGHSSHIAIIEAIELARANDIHMLCIPAHTTYILQPLDVGVFKSFKSFYSKECRKLLLEHPNRVITAEKIAGLVGRVRPQAITPVNIMSGFKKCGVYPLNPGEVTDRQIAPSTLYSSEPAVKDTVTPTCELYRKRYEEGYDIPDKDYLRWLHENNLKLPTSFDIHTMGTSGSSVPESLSACSAQHCESTSSSLSDILALPEPISSKKKRNPAVNAKASCITDIEVLETLKHKKEQKEAKEEEKRMKRLEREKKRKEREKKRKKPAKPSDKRVTRSKSSSLKTVTDKFSGIQINDDTEDESEAECPGCGLVYGSADDHQRWVQCDACSSWWDMACASIDEQENFAEFEFCCPNCS